MRSSRQAEDVYQQILCKFILNLPSSELAKNRLWYHYEKAYFYYLDHQKHIGHHKNRHDNNNPNTNNSNQAFHLSQPEQIVQFIQTLNKYTPKGYKADARRISEQIKLHYQKIPVCGTILLNQTRDKAVCIVSSANKLGFPKGKIDEDETLFSCAIRECWQEIGVDVSDKLSEQNAIQVWIDQKLTTFFVAYGLKQESTVFRTQAKTEVNKIQWLSLAEIQADKTLNRVSHLALKILMSRLEQAKGSDSRLAAFERNLKAPLTGIPDQNPFKTFSFDRQKLIEIFKC